MIFWWKPWRRDEDREDVCSKDGQVTFNYLQQRLPECDERCPTPLEQLGTTDPWGITTDP